MLAPQSDANVLYGLIALELGLTTRAELTGALAEWASGRSRGVDAILIGRGRIAPEAHALLEPLVLGQTGGGPSPPVEAGAVANGRWQTGYEETVGLLDTAPAGGPLPTMSIPAALAQVSRVGMRFRILRPHNEGGLGVISVARDEELGRQVALKEIKLRYADDPDSRARFLLEAELTGKLEHPGIVPVYGLGAYADGRPYYAMRLIRGDSLAEAIEQLHKGGKSGFDPVRRSLSSRQLVERFLDVCDTIEYAHSRGVIHRDIKPDNIMLGPFGETLVVDWGLARPMGEALGASGRTGEGPVKAEEVDLPAEVEGTPTGTPRYMSPEQARGELDRLGAPTDVYGLGATLYHLLTGEPPLRGVQGTEVYRRVEQGKIATPRAVNRRVPRALDAITTRAMAMRPEDRYPSARALAEDLRRWLADEPVSAWRESPVARLGRWGRRNRSSVLAGVVALAVVSTVSIAAALTYKRSARSERLASARALVAQHQAELSQKDMRIAREQAAQAHRRVIRGTARFAAEMIGREVTAIGSVLQAEAEEPRAAELLSRAVAAPDDTAALADLRAWIASVYRMHRRTIIVSNFFVVGPDGVQLARAPFVSTSVGQDFSYRDYFHGRGRDLKPDEVAELRAEGLLGIIEGLHQTRVFNSVATGNPMTTFSVPIRDPSRDGRPIGVLGLSVEVGDFDVLRTGAGEDLVASLIETRRDESDRAGLVLQHPGLVGKGADVGRKYLDEGRVARLVLLREAAMQAVGRGLDPAGLDPALAVDLDYEDPVGGPFAGRWLAAFQPVIAEGPEGPWDTGWVVVVQGSRLGAGAAEPSPP